MSQLDEAIKVIEGLRDEWNDKCAETEVFEAAHDYGQWAHAADAILLRLKSLSVETAVPDNRPPIDVTQRHDFVLIKGSDRCGLRGCTHGVLEHAWIPPASIVFATSCACLGKFLDPMCPKHGVTPLPAESPRPHDCKQEGCEDWYHEI